MYRRILVALENGRADEALVSHVTRLAGLFHSHLLLVHVADGWAARHFDALKLSQSEEMQADQNYLDARAAGLRALGLSVSTRLALGDPPAEILKILAGEDCDLVAMGMHGHRLLGDLLFGSTISAVRHKSRIPLLLVPSS
jgi:nucleotide-binding universal stress UspA family protein